jgi:hypothetical protein
MNSSLLPLQWAKEFSVRRALVSDFSCTILYCSRFVCLAKSAGKDFRDGAVAIRMVWVHSSFEASVLFGLLPYFLPFSS